MKVIGYARVSTQDQTTDTQIAQIQKYCEMKGLTDLTIYQDVISGSKSSRPDLDRMMQRIRAGGGDLVITVYLSRLGRSQAHLIQILEEFKNRNVRYVALNDGIDTGTPTGSLLYGILASLAEFEREQIRERTALRLARLKEQGVKLGRKGKLDKDPGARTRILNLIRNKPDMSLRDLEFCTGYKRSWIHNLVKNDPGCFDPGEPFILRFYLYKMEEST